MVSTALARSRRPVLRANRENESIRPTESPFDVRILSSSVNLPFAGQVAEHCTSWEGLIISILTAMESEDLGHADSPPRLHVGSVTATPEAVGEGFRYSLDPPYHAVTEASETLCGIPVQWQHPSNWDTAILKERCDECERLASPGLTS